MLAAAVPTHSSGFLPHSQIVMWLCHWHSARTIWWALVAVSCKNVRILYCCYRHLQMVKLAHYEMQHICLSGSSHGYWEWYFMGNDISIYEAKNYWQQNRLCCATSVTTEMKHPGCQIWCHECLMLLLLPTEPLGPILGWRRKHECIVSFVEENL